MVRNIQSFFHGFSQIMLQEKFLTGFLILFGIFYGSWLMGVSAVIAVLCANITAVVLGYDKELISKGLYGFNAALVGVAVMLFLKPAGITWMLMVAGAIGSAMLHHFFMKKNIPAFTFAFVLSTWIILAVTHFYFPHLEVKLASEPNAVVNYFTLGFRGFGQVIFQAKLLSGILFFAAVFLSSPIAAVYALVAAVLTGYAATFFNLQVTDIAMGLLSFNAVLCAIVFAGKKITDVIWAAGVVAFSLFISILFLKNNLPQLTFPFVLSSFIGVIVKKQLLQKNQ